MENLPEITRCPICGDLCYPDELTNNMEGETVCEYCYEDQLAEVYPSLLDHVDSQGRVYTRRRGFDDDEE